MSEGVDVGVITIIPTEIDALFRIFGIDKDNDRRRLRTLEYWRATIFSPRNKRYLNLGISFVRGTAGNIDSAITATLMGELLRPRIMYLVGIAAGAEGKTRIGDVIIPDTVHDATIAVRKSDKTFLPRMKNYRIDSRISGQLKLRRVDEALGTQRSELTQEDIEKLRALAVRVKLRPEDIAHPVGIKDGSIVSSNTLLRDSTYFPEFQATNDERCRALEMEAAGFARACELTGTPWIVVRGVSDYGDDRKGDEFQHLAASNASHASRVIIENIIDLVQFPRQAGHNAELSLFESLESALGDAYKARKWDFVVEIGSFLSRPLWIAGKYEVRRRIGELVEDAAAHCKRHSERASALIDDIGWTYFVLKDADKARKAISDGLLIAEKQHDWYLCAKASRHLASIARQSDDYGCCEEQLTAAGQYAVKIGNKDAQREIDVTLKVSNAKLLIARERPAEAITLLEDAEKHFGALHDHFRLVKIYQTLGDAHSKANDVASAIASYKTGFERASALGRRDEALGNAASLALASKKAGLDEDARTWANKTIELASEMQDAEVPPEIIDILK
jgi:nucleoside phosphorylase